jgi:hypothetical protein
MSVKLPDDIHVLTEDQTTKVAECVKTDDWWRSLRNERPISLRKLTERLESHTAVQ